MVRTQIQLTEAQHEALKRIASARRVSVAELVRQGVDAVISYETAPVTDEERRERALEIMGKGHSGKSDIARRHDEYLGKDFK